MTFHCGYTHTRRFNAAPALQCWRDLDAYLDHRGGGGGGGICSAAGGAGRPATCGGTRRRSPRRPTGDPSDGWLSCAEPRMWNQANPLVAPPAPRGRVARPLRGDRSSAKSKIIDALTPGGIATWFLSNQVLSTGGPFPLSETKPCGMPCNGRGDTHIQARRKDMPTTFLGGPRVTSPLLFGACWSRQNRYCLGKNHRRQAGPLFGFTPDTLSPAPPRHLCRPFSPPSMIRTHGGLRGRFRNHSGRIPNELPPAAAEAPAPPRRRPRRSAATRPRGPLRSQG